SPFFHHPDLHNQVLHSFPTRRSSDLSTTATPSSHNLNRPRVAGAANSSVRIARDLFWLRIREKDEDNLTSFFMTSPQFERLQPRYSRNQKSLELVPHPN